MELTDDARRALSRADENSSRCFELAARVQALDEGLEAGRVTPGAYASGMAEIRDEACRLAGELRTMQAAHNVTPWAVLSAGVVIPAYGEGS